MFATLSTSILFVTGLLLRGEPTCPTLSDVLAAKNKLPPEAGAAALSNAIIELSSAPRALYIRRITASGEVEAEKIIEVMPGGCARAAEQAALLLAFWEAELDSGLALSLPAALPSEAVEDPAATDALADAPQLAASARPAPSPPAEQRRWAAELSVAAFAARSGSAFAPAGEVAWRLRPVAAPLGFVVSVLMTDELAQPYVSRPGTEVRWQQAWVGAGPAFALPVGKFQLGADVQAQGGVVRMRGAGFERNLSGTNAELGLRTSLTLAWAPGPWRPWVGAMAAVRGRQQEAVVSGEGDAQRLPAFAFMLGGGVSFASVL